MTKINKNITNRQTYIFIFLMCADRTSFQLEMIKGSKTIYWLNIEQWTHSISRFCVIDKCQGVSQFPSADIVECPTISRIWNKIVKIKCYHERAQWKFTSKIPYMICSLLSLLLLLLSFACIFLVVFFGPNHGGFWTIHAIVHRTEYFLKWKKL